MQNQMHIVQAWVYLIVAAPLAAAWLLGLYADWYGELYWSWRTVSTVKKVCAVVGCACAIVVIATGIICDNFLSH